MNRLGLTVALAIAVVTGVVFGIYPQLDLRLAALFYSATGFPMFEHPTLGVLRDVATLIIGLLALPAVLSLIAKLVRPEKKMLVPARTSVFLAGTLLLAPILSANVILKDNWGRPRPHHVAEFGGPAPFLPWWDPRGACPVNCSFVGGESAGAFWTMAPAALAPPQWRPLAYGAALAFGTAVSVMRIAAGGHFFTDVVFAGVITFTIIWLMHGLLYRRQRHPTDASVEAAIERIAFAIRRPFGGGRDPVKPAPEKR